MEPTDTPPQSTELFPHSFNFTRESLGSSSDTPQEFVRRRGSGHHTLPSPRVLAAEPGRVTAAPGMSMSRDKMVSTAGRNSGQRSAWSMWMHLRLSWLLRRWQEEEDPWEQGVTATLCTRRTVGRRGWVNPTRDATLPACLRSTTSLYRHCVFFRRTWPEVMWVFPCTRGSSGQGDPF